MSVTVKFKIKKSKIKFPENTYILAWTTTPWTLPGNVALAVGSNIEYVLAKPNGGDEHFIIAADLANKVLGAPLAIERQFNGSELVGTSYEPLFSVKALKKPKSYKVYDADFVSTTDGTGVVHTAVMYGEDDYQLGTKLGLVKQHTVDEQGKFFGVSDELDGMYVKSAGTEALVLEQLKTNNLLKTSAYEHEYPFCWRCDTPLLYYAKDSWFIRTSAVNAQLLANNDTVNWIPEHLKDGRFGQWLREGKDWAFSRERYWGTPLPIWRTKDGKQTIVAHSMEDLDTYRGDTPARFWVMRHGEALKNVDHIIDAGELESPLTDVGKAQVVAAAQILKKQLSSKRAKLAAVISSPIQRAHETATIAARELGMKSITTDDRLREIKLGPTLAGCHDSKYHELYPTYESKFTQRPPDGESLTDLKTRMWLMLSDLNTKYAGKDILLVSHEYPIWMMMDAAQAWNMEQSIAEKTKRGDDFIGFASIESLVVRNLPRDTAGTLDLHRPFIDDIVLKRPNSSAKLYRVPEIADVWFDSGAMPYAQWHWPFENEHEFRQQFPADFICEAIDQTRGWFYTLLAVSTLLGDSAPYKNVMSLGHILDEKGQKMSKSKGNIVLPDEVFNAVGIDATRWYFYTVNSPGDTKNFSMKEVRERLTGFMMTLNNCRRFYELYKADKSIADNLQLTTGNLLDTWILSRLSEVTALATTRLDVYDITIAARELERFVVDDFSQWWLRRSRKRSDALPLLRHILRSLALLLAPFIPYMAEELWQKLKSEGDPLSVHLADWAVADDAAVDFQLHRQMEQVREYISAVLRCAKNSK